MEIFHDFQISTFPNLHDRFPSDPLGRTITSARRHARARDPLRAGRAHRRPARRDVGAPGPARAPGKSRRSRSTEAIEAIEQGTEARLRAAMRPSLVRVINATGRHRPHQPRAGAAVASGARPRPRGRRRLHESRIRPRPRRPRPPRRARRETDRPPHRRRLRRRRQQQRGGDDAAAGGAGERTRSDHLARRAGRDRRRLPRAGRDGAVRGDPARGGDDEPDARGRLRRGDRRSDRPDPARPSVQLQGRGLHRAPVARGAGRARPTLRDSGGGGSRQRLAGMAPRRGSGRA